MSQRILFAVLPQRLRILIHLLFYRYTYSGTWGDLQKCTKMKNKLSEKVQFLCLKSCCRSTKVCMNSTFCFSVILNQWYIRIHSILYGTQKKEEETIANQIQEFMVLYINGDDDTFPNDALISIEYICILVTAILYLLSSQCIGAIKEGDFKRDSVKRRDLSAFVLH